MERTQFQAILGEIITYLQSQCITRKDFPYIASVNRGKTEFLVSRCAASTPSCYQYRHGSEFFDGKFDGTHGSLCHYRKPDRSGGSEPLFWECLCYCRTITAGVGAEQDVEASKHEGRG